MEVLLLDLVVELLVVLKFALRETVKVGHIADCINLATYHLAVVQNNL